MTVATALFLIAVGAILRYATDFDVKGVEIDTVGLILMIVGIVGFVLGLFYDLVYARQSSRWYRSWGRDDRYAPPPGPDDPTRRL